MLLAPFTLDPIVSNAHNAQARAHKPRVRIPGWLLVWASLGTLACIVFPPLRGDAIGGLSLPFWLCVAPMLDLLWLTRQRWFPTSRARARRPCRSRQR